MKRILAIAFALGLSAPAALAECAYHNAAAKVDKTTTASVAPDTQQTTSGALALLKEEATAAEEKTAE